MKDSSNIIFHLGTKYGSTPIAPEALTSNTAQLLVEESPEVLREPGKAYDEPETEPAESGGNQDVIHFIPREVPVIILEGEQELTEDDVDSISFLSTSQSSHSSVHIEDVNSVFDESFGTIYETSDESINTVSEQTVHISSDDASETIGEYPDPPSAGNQEDFLAFHTGWRNAMVRGREMVRVGII